MTLSDKMNCVRNVRADDEVEVRSAEEILASLDENGELDSIPFMPEMLQFCGKRFRVYRRADRTCDTINNSGLRRLKDSVHLENIRCGGEAHGGCQARCLIFWKEAWLKRVEPTLQERVAFPVNRTGETAGQMASTGSVTGCTLSKLAEKTRKVTGEEASPDDARYSCQATELFRATAPLSARELGPYLHDLRSGNVSLREMLRAICLWMFRRLVQIGGYRVLVWAYDRVQELIGGCPYPYKQGALTSTPAATLNLQPGELVQVKSQEEILKTVDKRNRNRGLSFDVEMVRYCGGKYRVLQKVEKIINERTGKMIQFSAPPIMLDGVTCRSEFSPGKLFCSRSIYSYWREIWLRRVE